MNIDKQINYVEFPAADLAATKTFFAGVFGWEFQDYGPDYIAFSGAGIDGGFFRSELNSRTAQGGALVVIYAADLETMHAAVVDAGGTILQDIFTFPGGRRFHLQEPSGNELAVWSEK